MKIVIIGVGKIGLALAGSLSAEGHDLTLIDTDQAVIDAALNSFDVNGIAGNGVNYSVQSEAGVGHADVVIATTSSDEINMLCCLVAKKLGVRRTVARIRDPEYSKNFITLLDKMGLDLAVNPEFATAREISKLIRYPSAIALNSFAKGKVDVAEMRVPEGSPLDGVKMKNLSKKLDARVLICAILRGDELIIPNGESSIYADDRIFFTSSHDQLSAFFREMGVFRTRLKNAFIIGGGRIAYYLASMLCDTGVSVKVVEIDEKRCLELCELLPKAHIICGDGTDMELLDEENFSDTDVCIAVTGRDEENIIVGMYAKREGIEKSVIKVSKTHLGDMFRAVGLDSVVSPKTLTENMILRYIRAMKSARGGEVLTVCRLADDRVEAVEFHASEDSRAVNIPLFKLELKKDLLICCIIRDNNIIILGGNDVIRAGDNVVVAVRSEKLSTLDDILS